MGKWIKRIDPSTVHVHDMPNGVEGPTTWAEGSIWRCSCGIQWKWAYSGSGRGVTWIKIRPDGYLDYGKLGDNNG